MRTFGTNYRANFELRHYPKSVRLDADCGRGAGGGEDRLRDRVRIVLPLSGQPTEGG